MNKIFCVDIGNSTIAIGIFENNELLTSFRFATNKEFLATEYQLMINSVLQNKEILKSDFDGAIISSTVPSLLNNFELAINDVFGFSPMVVGPGIKTGLNIKYENPKEIGPDRILHAIAGLNIASAPLIIVDLGTGLVFDVIDSEENYLGGAIAPGVSVAAEALFNKGSMLNSINIQKPESVIGKNTRSALESGIYFGSLELIKGITEKMKGDLKGKATVIGTGGDISIFKDDLNFFDYVEPDLNLYGLHLLYLANAKDKNDK
ncbi:MAG: pantothenate kinase [Chloroflexi bacterium]|nr:pantothenate kinase [Chloroflexota bacterium]|tara:strand:+ start:2238 stop:3026 length:789 start_codon:yes stop_codon:yes gene_type:complete